MRKKELEKLKKLNLSSLYILEMAEVAKKVAFTLHECEESNFYEKFEKLQIYITGRLYLANRELIREKHRKDTNVIDHKIRICKAEIIDFLKNEIIYCSL